MNNENAKALADQVIQRGDQIASAHKLTGWDRAKFHSYFQALIELMMPEPVQVVNQAVTEFEELQRQAAAYLNLRKLCGHVENGTDTVVTVFQDDATKQWWVKVGTSNRRKDYYDASLTRALQDAVNALPPEG